MNYAAYLRSTDWKVRRYRALDDANFRCQRCGCRGARDPYGHYGLDVHHLNYDRLGKERREDLEVLCRPCHDGAHEITTGLDVSLLRATIKAGNRAMRR